jgi:hypothetical protein
MTRSFKESANGHTEVKKVQDRKSLTSGFKQRKLYRMLLIELMVGSRLTAERRERLDRFKGGRRVAQRQVVLEYRWILHFGKVHLEKNDPTVIIHPVLPRELTSDTSAV